MVRTATLKSVARATGFSVTTVSRALGGFDDVNEQTRRIIIEEARRQGYEPNVQARALQKQRSQTIGFVIPTEGPGFPDPFFGEFIAGVGSEATSQGFDLLLSTTSEVEGELDVYRRMVSGRRVDGLVLVRSRVDDARIAFLSHHSFPFAVFGRTQSVPDYLHIDVDGIAGQSVLTQHFLSLGHRRIAYITAPLNFMFSHFRLQGFREAMQNNGVPIDESLILEGGLTARSGKDLAHHLLTRPDPPTAIMTGNDLVAIGVMDAAQELGLQVGRDIAVGGFDDIPAAEHLRPGLTTVQQPIFAIGRQLTNRLIQSIEDRLLSDGEVLVKPALMVRESSGVRRNERKGGVSEESTRPPQHRPIEQ